MPAELRLLVFSLREFGEGLSELRKAKERSWPQGQVVSIKTSPAKAFRLVVEVVSPAGEAKRFELDSGTAVAAMVAYCLAHSIPLPRAASRSIQVAGGSLALRLTLGTPEVEIEKSV